MREPLLHLTWHKRLKVQTFKASFVPITLATHCRHGKEIQMRIKRTIPFLTKYKWKGEAMRNFKDYIYKAIVIFSTFAIILITGCGGGGGGNGGAPPQTGGAQLTANNTPQAGSAVIQALYLGGPLSAAGEIQPLSISSKTSSKNYSKPPLRSILDKVVSISKAQRHKSEVHAAGSMPPTTESCTGGGNVTVSATWQGPDEPTDPSQIVNFNGNITFNSCKEDTVTLNGSMNIAFEGPLSNPTKLTISASNFTYADSETGDNITMANFKLVFTDGTMTLAGTIRGTVDGESVNEEYDKFRMAFSSDIGGITVSISGRVNPSCLGGWVTITTNTLIFIPKDADCPTAGEVVITSGGNSARMVIASDYKITIYFNGTLVQTYNDCEEVDGLCAG